MKIMTDSPKVTLHLLEVIIVDRSDGNSMGMVLRAEDGHVYVQELVAGGAAWYTGCIGEGMELIRLNGELVAGMKLKAVQKELDKHTVSTLQVRTRPTDPDEEDGGADAGGELRRRDSINIAEGDKGSKLAARMPATWC